MQYHGYGHQGLRGNRNFADYGEDESDASTMTSISGTCAGYYEDQKPSATARSSRSRATAAMSAESIASRSSSVPGNNPIRVLPKLN